MSSMTQQNGITQHLSETTLSEYACGTLNEGMEVLVACHLTLCPKCRKQARDADQMGGYFIDEAEPLKPRLSAVEVLRNISTVATNDSVSNSTATNAKVPDYSKAARHGIPKPLARQLSSNFDELNWKPLAKGIQQINLKRGGSKKDGAFKLLKLQPGVELIEHSHGHQELTLILQGSYSDEYGQYGVGDVADLGAEHQHKPVIDSDIPCIALIASDSPAHYRGLMGRLIQPFVDI